MTNLMMMLPLNDDDTSIESEFICIFNDGKKMLLNDLIFGHQQTSLSDVTVIEKKEREKKIMMRTLARG